MVKNKWFENGKGKCTKRGDFVDKLKWTVDGRKIAIALNDGNVAARQ